MSASHDKSRSQQAHKKELWSLWRVVLLGCVLGLLTAGAVAIFSLIIVSIDSWLWWASRIILFAGVVSLPITTQFVFHRRLSRARHAGLLGWSYGFSIGPFLVIAHELGWFHVPIINNPMQVLLVSLAYGVFGTVFMLVFWAVSRKARGKLRVIDGTACPNCQYELKGCDSAICPECGEPFDADELEFKAGDSLA